MAIEGPLRELGIHDVFQLLDVSRKTGVLTVTSRLRQNQGTVYFDRGAIVHAEIRSNPHRLGQLLLQAGRITDADLDRAQAMQRQGDSRRLGEILVAIGAITARELERQVRRQVEEVVFELMSWQEGYFSFVEGPLPEVVGEAPLRLPTEAVLMEGARRIDEWSRIESKIPHLDVVPALAPADEGAHAEGLLDLLPGEWEVLAAVDGERTLRSIAAALGRSEFEVAKIVFGLTAAGIVTLRESRPPTGRLAATPDVEELIRQAQRALEAGDLEGARSAAEAAGARDGADPAVEVLLARVALAAHREADAEAHARRALKLDASLREAYRLLGDALVLQGRFAEAVDWWRRWLEVGSPASAAEVDKVQEAVHAAQTLELLIRGSHG
jgi:hypothetical protein